MTTTFKNGLGKFDTGFYYYCFRLDGRQFRGIDEWRRTKRIPFEYHHEDHLT